MLHGVKLICKALGKGFYVLGKIFIVYINRMLFPIVDSLGAPSIASITCCSHPHRPDGFHYPHIPLFA